MRWMLILFAVAVLGLSGFAGWFFFGGPENDPTRRAMNAHIKRIEAKIPAAEAGNINAQFQLARLYHNADHIEADPKAAFKWYSMAAETGHVGPRISSAPCTPVAKPSAKIISAPRNGTALCLIWVGMLMPNWHWATFISKGRVFLTVMPRPFPGTEVRPAGASSRPVSPRCYVCRGLCWGS